MSVAFFLQQSVPALMPVIIFATYIGLGNELQAVSAFVTIQFIGLLQGPLMMITGIGTQLALASASATRITKFLYGKDLDIYVNKADDLLYVNYGDDKQDEPTLPEGRYSYGHCYYCVFLFCFVLSVEAFISLLFYSFFFLKYHTMHHTTHTHTHTHSHTPSLSSHCSI